MPASEPAPILFSEDSKAYESVRPGHKLACSLAVGWTSLLVQQFETAGSVESFEALASPDQLVVVVTGGCCDLESFSDGRWRKSVYRPGTVGMTAGGHADRLRWRSQGTAPLETLHLFIPQHFFSCVQDEYRRAGVRPQTQPLDALSLFDPVISRMAHSLAEAIQNGAPDLYAQSAAQFLATHLLSAQKRCPDPAQDKKRPGRLSDRRIAHVLEYMSAHHAEPISLDQLAGEACVSRFHFGRLFKERVGITPHHYLVKIRLDAAGSLLNDTDLSILDVALSCGYGSAAQFTAAFQKRFFQTPSSYRRTSQGFLR